MKILIATDGSKFSKAAVDEACKVLLSQPDTSVRIVSAFEATAMISAEAYVGTAAMYQQLADSLKSSAEEAVSEAALQIRAKCPSAKVDVEVMMGLPAEAILDKAKEWGANLIIVGSHGHGFWSRALLGSVSTAVVHHAECPVLVVRVAETQNGKRVK